MSWRIVWRCRCTPAFPNAVWQGPRQAAVSERAPCLNIGVAPPVLCTCGIMGDSQLAACWPLHETASCAAALNFAHTKILLDNYTSTNSNYHLHSLLFFFWLMTINEICKVEVWQTSETFISVTFKEALWISNIYISLKSFVEQGCEVSLFFFLLYSPNKPTQSLCCTLNLPLYLTHSVPSLQESQISFHSLGFDLRNQSYIKDS